MVEFINRNLEKTEPEYFYRVSEFVTTFGMDEGENGSFRHWEDFKGKDLHQCKAKAENHYWERLEGLNQGRYFLPFESPKNFELGKNASFSINMVLVEYYNQDKFFEYPLLGEDEETMAESREIEIVVLRSKS